MQFSQKTLSYLHDADFLRTKQQVMGQIAETFASLHAWQLAQTDCIAPYAEGIFAESATGKVARGERYEDLPYLVSDAPRFFGQRNVFAFRNMFWWGDAFSFVLHLAGEPLQRYRKTLPLRLQTLPSHEVYLCVHPSSPWVYHFRPDNYLLLSSAAPGTQHAHLFEKDFLKLAYRLPLHEAHRWSTAAQHSFRALLG